MPPVRSLSILCLALICLAGCGHTIKPEFAPNHHGFDFSNPPCPLSPPPVLEDNEVGIRYLGAGGLYVAWQGHALLLDPFFSNPGLGKVLFGRLASDPEAVRKGLQGLDLSRVRAIVVGHSHYDHLGDLPAVAEHVPGVPLYVNRTGANALGSALSDRTVILEEEKDWITLKGPAGEELPIRFRKVETKHAPHFWGVHLVPGQIPHPWTKPWKDHGFLSLREGTPHAFVIDLLTGGQPVFRIYHEDSSNPEGVGFPNLKDDYPYNLAVLCMASFQYVRNHPGSILGHLEPRHVLVTHYEDFLRDPSKPVRFVSGLTGFEANRFLRRTRDALGGLETEGPEGKVCGPSTSGWTMPRPGEWVRFRVARQ